VLTDLAAAQVIHETLEDVRVLMDVAAGGTQLEDVV